MKKQISSLLIILILILAPFAYFWHRDVSTLGVQTGASLCTPYNLSTEVDRFSIRLEWQTEVDCVSYLEYSLLANGENSSTVVGEDGIILLMDHTAEIRDLKPGTDYYVRIISNGQAYGDNGSPLLIRTKD